MKTHRRFMDANRLERGRPRPRPIESHTVFAGDEDLSALPALLFNPHGPCFAASVSLWFNSGR